MTLCPDWAPPIALAAWIVGLRTIAAPDPAALEESQALAERALALDPLQARAWVAKGYVCTARRRYDQALEAFVRAIEVDPQDFLAPYFAACSEMFTGRPQDAIPRYRHSLELEPRQGMGWLGLGSAFLGRGLLGEARHAFERALALEGDPAAINRTAASASYLAEVARLQGDPARARRMALEGVAAAEASDLAYRDFFRGYGLGVLGRAALDAGDHEAARAAFGQLLAMMKGRPGVRGGGHLVVQALAGVARASCSEALWQEALQLFSGQGTYRFDPMFGCLDDKDLFELALAARAVGQPEAARDLLARARAAGASQPFLE